MRGVRELRPGLELAQARCRSPIHRFCSAVMVRAHCSASSNTETDGCRTPAALFPLSKFYLATKKLLDEQRIGHWPSHRVKFTRSPFLCGSRGEFLRNN